VPENITRSDAQKNGGRPVRPSPRIPDPGSLLDLHLNRTGQRGIELRP
jgi:hypothetical protein